MPTMVRSWSGSVRFQPARIALPETEAEIVEIVRDCARRGESIRVVGSAHSFTPLIETAGALISLDRMQGIKSVDPQSHSAVVRAGTKLKTLGKLLFAQGLGMENLGDIDAQSIAGTVSTGTHGTGIGFGTISTQLEELTLITADGSRLTCSESHNPDIFRAAQVSFGSLGLITEVKLRTLPAFKLEFVQKKETLAECLQRLDEHCARNRHFEFFYFPGARTVQSKFTNLTDEPAKENSIGSYLNDVVLENLLFKLISEISRWIPGTSLAMSRLCAWGVSEIRKVGWSHNIFSVPRHVKFNEMEYCIPRERFRDCLTEMIACIEREKHRVHFPMECRFVKRDDIWLSPAYQRDSAYISVHMYKGMEHRRYFDAMESIFRYHHGRPHWGKMHSLKATDFERLYPRWEDFNRIRRRLDPRGVFMTPYLRSLLEKESK